MKLLKIMTSNHKKNFQFKIFKINQIISFLKNYKNKFNKLNNRELFINKLKFNLNIVQK